MTPCTFLNFVLICTRTFFKKKSTFLKNEKALLLANLRRYIMIRRGVVCQVSLIRKLQPSSCFGCCTPLPELTEDNERVIIVAFLNDDSSKCNIYDFYKMTFKVTDMRTIEDYNLADICIFDCQHFTAADIVKWTSPVIKKTKVVFLVSTEKNCVLSKIYLQS